MYIIHARTQDTQIQFALNADALELIFSTIYSNMQERTAASITDALPCIVPCRHMSSLCADSSQGELRFLARC